MDLIFPSPGAGTPAAPRTGRLRRDHRKGFNAAGGFGYDITRGFLQNQLVQVSYNGGCCGIAVEYRRIARG